MTVKVMRYRITIPSFKRMTLGAQEPLPLLRRSRILCAAKSRV